MKQLFLVEDDQDIAKNLGLLLRREGFAVTHAATQRRPKTLTITVFPSPRTLLGAVNIPYDYGTEL